MNDVIYGSYYLCVTSTRIIILTFIYKFLIDLEQLAVEVGGGVLNCQAENVTPATRFEFIVQWVKKGEYPITKKKRPTA